VLIPLQAQLTSEYHAENRLTAANVPIDAGQPDSWPTIPQLSSYELVDGGWHGPAGRPVGSESRCDKRREKQIRGYLRACHL